MEIKGIANNNDDVIFISSKSSDIEIEGNLAIQGNLTVNGETIGPEPPLEIVSFNEATDEQLTAMLNAHYAGDINIEEYWHVGDTRKVHLNGIASPNTNKYTEAWSEQDITIVITALNHHDLNEQIGTRIKAAVTVQTRECLNNLSSQGDDENGCVFVNLNNDIDTIFKKWSELPLRTWMNSTFLTTCFSEEMQNMIKKTKHKRLTTNGTSSRATEEVIDKLFLPSYPEVYGNISYSYYLSGATPAGEEGTQWDYYKTSSNRVKKGNNNGSANSISCFWWQGSPSSDYESNYSYRWCCVNYTGNTARNYGGNARGLAPAFCL